MYLLPTPLGLSDTAWLYTSLFVTVIVTIILEPMPAAYVGLVGIVLACIFQIGPPDTDTTTSTSYLNWGLSGFSNSTVWLIFTAFMFAMGYEKTGLGRRISLLLVRYMGKRTLGLGYAIVLADLILAPFMPSNTARSGGTIFPIVKNIPELYGSSPKNEPRKIGAYISWVALAGSCISSSLFLTALAPNLLAMSIL